MSKMSSDMGVALVTGAGQRIGRAVAIKLAAAGWSVAVHYHQSEVLAEETVEIIRSSGGNAIKVKAALENEIDVLSLVSIVSGSLGTIKCLINNASVFEFDDIDTVTKESWDTHMAVNLRAPFLLCQAFWNSLPQKDTGVIINILDQRVWNLTPHFISYTVSKAGLWTLTQSLALALAPRIRVNAIGPGPVLPSPRQSEAQFMAQCKSTPLERGADPEDISEAVLFILGATSMTGQMIALDGGQHLSWGAGSKHSIDE